MKIKKTLTRCLLHCSVLTVIVSAAATQSAEAQKKLGNNGWRWLPHSSDHFNDTALGWQWRSSPDNTWWQFEKAPNGTWSHFRDDNVIMTGSQLVIRNKYHWTPQKEWSPFHKRDITYTYSGGWMESKANWLVEGQFQVNCKVDRLFKDIWPAFWTVFKDGLGGGDELDIFEYESGIVGFNHFKHRNGKIVQASVKKWKPNDPNAPAWHYTWAMDRTKDWANWACRNHKGWNNAQFFLNGKREYTNRVIAPAVSPMEMIFSCSPHAKHRPRPSNDYPFFRVNWVETHIP